MRTETNWIASCIHIFNQYKLLAERAMDQLDEKGFFFTPDAESNSIAIIVKHMSGNMKSRWTNFLIEDGEKVWRQRDNEFILFPSDNKTFLMKEWETGWNCLFNSITPLQPNDLGKIIKIRNEDHSVMEAINRQIAHYCYHVGQIVFLAKLFQSNQWQTLSIAKGKSDSFNQSKFKK